MCVCLLYMELNGIEKIVGTDAFVCGYKHICIYIKACICVYVRIERILFFCIVGITRNYRYARINVYIHMIT